MKELFFTLIMGYYSSFTFGQTIMDTSEVKMQEPIYTLVDEMPRYPNGEKALRDTFAKYIQYPEYEKENKIKGTVIVGFIVTEMGAIENLEIKKGVSEGLDAEALRLIRMIPSFIPGKQQGKPVNVAYVLPILFKLPKDR
jgi:protein TonB